MHTKVNILLAFNRGSIVPLTFQMYIIPVLMIIWLLSSTDF